ncbi:hypothetical protein GCM10010873_26870 [Cypionkella aquatica]|uniref:Uncharacterized protein n=1 Tax=Cypionkella aquatica TaxID=1756042 RepID=A0AA37TXK8_9RHOB|nr:hypothetical protein [Cypionkella aquatica]GLS87713.1 hypothetical protein GCM10010873_26870 [Cypionkella aquatica]
MTEEFLSLSSAPWTTVLTFAAGYAGYFIAHVGLREHHQALDQLFRVMLYGFWGLFTYLAARIYGGVEILSASALGFLVSALLGVAWRRVGGPWLTRVLRGSRASLSDDLPSAWGAISAVGERVHGRQIMVTLADGTALFCDDLSKFVGLPNGPCVFGAAGDLLIYATHTGRDGPTGATIWEPVESQADAFWGAQITYVPKEQILRIKYRRVLS